MKSFPSKTSNVRPVSAAALLFVGLTLASISLAGAAEFPCQEGTGTPTLELVWKGLDKESDLIKPTGSMADLRIQNNGTQTLFVELSASAVLDNRRESQDLGLVPVPGLSRVSVLVDLGAFGVAPAVLDFAGRVSVKGVARNDQGAPVTSVAYSPPVFFHEQAAQLYVYRQKVLLDQFGAGDFADRATKLRQWTVDRGLTLVGVSYYDPDLPLSDDDGGPSDDPPHQRHSLTLTSQETH